MEALLPLTGAIASLWIIVGIYVASRFYPNYSHTEQFCSELGAFGSPTQKLSPAINNYPLSLLFCAYGIYLIMSSGDLASLSIGVMIVIHGLGTLVCGYFPMDADPYTQTPTNSCKIHSLAGLFMLLSLLVAPIIVIFSASFPDYLRVFSLVCIVGCFYFSYTLAKAFKARTNPGLHQRLSYGFQILWLFGFSIFTAYAI